MPNAAKCSRVVSEGLKVSVSWDTEITPIRMVTCFLRCLPLPDACLHGDVESVGLRQDGETGEDLFTVSRRRQPGHPPRARRNLPCQFDGMEPHPLEPAA